MLEPAEVFDNGLRGNPEDEKIHIEFMNKFAEVVRNSVTYEILKDTEYVKELLRRKRND